MTVSLPPALEAWVENRVKNGLATSSDEVVQEALQVMILIEQAQAERLEDLKALIEAGLESIDPGRVSVVNDKLIADIKRQANQNRSQISIRGRPFAGVKRANIKALKLGLFNPTEELEKMNEGAKRDLDWPLQPLSASPQHQSQMQADARVSQLNSFHF
jgi:putative addiction module CopG family antidote